MSFLDFQWLTRGGTVDSSHGGTMLFALSVPPGDNSAPLKTDPREVLVRRAEGICLPLINQNEVPPRLLRTALALEDEEDTALTRRGQNDQPPEEGNPRCNHLKKGNRK